MSYYLFDLHLLSIYTKISQSNNHLLHTLTNYSSNTTYIY